MPATGVTRVAVLTPQGRSAVAVVAIVGPEAEAAADAYFQPANQRALEKQALGRIVFGRWGGPAGEEVVVCRRAAGSVEVHCHGGIAASAAILDALVRAGCRVVPWTDVIAESEPDPISLAARIAMSEAGTLRTAAILLDQYRGALRSAFTEIDELANSTDEQLRREALRKIEILLSRASVGQHLTAPWRVAIAGQPNVGKSSLINALVGYDRAIVFEAPGTTRDVVTAQTAFDGWPVELSDTAGLRGTTDVVEAAGVARARAQLASADLAVLVFDLSRVWTDLDRDLLAQHPHALVIHNKCDVPHAAGARPAGIRTSAITGEGLVELEGAIVKRWATLALQPGDAVPFAPEHILYLQAVQTRLARPAFT